ncbi:MAG: hypothetical protein ACR2OZ_10820 [Verrucomicrobiales bacterium]
MTSLTRVEAQAILGDFEFDTATPTRMKIYGVFDPPPPSGFLAVRIVTSNGLADPTTWQIKSSSSLDGGRAQGRIDSQFEVAVDPGASRTDSLLVPLCPQLLHWWGSRELEVSVGTGNVPEQSALHHGQGAADFPAIAISKKLAEKSLTSLNDEMGKKKGRGYGNGLFGSRFDPDLLPEQWLGYGGFDALIITGDEWLKAAPGSRAAVLQWTRFGGRLHIYTTNDGDTLGSFGLPGKTGRQAARSFGEIELRSWNGDALEAGPTVGAYVGLPRRLKTINEEFKSTQNWPLIEALGTRNRAGWQVIAFLLLFGILVGPINLFVLAPAGRRHRLFFTTPAISLGASLLVVVIILLQDGTGGKGRRFIAIDLQPSEASAYVTQAQVSRSGVLLASGFELPQPALFAQVVMPASQWTKLNDSPRSQAVRGTIEGNRYGGTWFQSRTEQGQWLQTIVPTRGRVELVPAVGANAAPAIVSSLDLVLDPFVYRDAAGLLWRAAQPVKKGVPLTLVATDDNGLRSWRFDLCAPAHDSLRKRLEASADSKSTFVAATSAAPDFAAETLESIKWENDRIVVFGPLGPPGG